MHENIRNFLQILWFFFFSFSNTYTTLSKLINTHIIHISQIKSIFLWIWVKTVDCIKKNSWFFVQLYCHWTEFGVKEKKIAINEIIENCKETSTCKQFASHLIGIQRRTRVHTQTHNFYWLEFFELPKTKRKKNRFYH